MKFVHLAPKTAVSRIQRHGIRLGTGRRGKGVYATPLFQIPLRTYKHSKGLASEAIDLSEPMSSIALWRKLFRFGSRRGRRPIAIVFEPTDDHYPAALFVEVQAAWAYEFLDRIRALRSVGVGLAEKDVRFVLDAADQGIMADLAVEVGSDRAVGLLLREYLSSGAAPWSGYDETIEVVFRKPIPPSSIRRLIALSKQDRIARDSSADDGSVD